MLRGDRRVAAPRLHAGVRRLAEAGETTFVLYGLLACSALAVATQPEPSVMLHAATLRHATDRGVCLSLAASAQVRTLIEEAQERLTPEQRASAASQGQSLTLDQTIALALAVTAAPHPVSAAGRSAGKARISQA